MTNSLPPRRLVEIQIAPREHALLSRAVSPRRFKHHLARPTRILHTTGRGHYVGTVQLSVIQNQPGWFGEGDDFWAHVDGREAGEHRGQRERKITSTTRGRCALPNGPYFGVTVADNGTDLGLAHDRVPMAHRRSDSLHQRIEVRHRVHAGWTYNNDGTVRSAFERARRPLQ